MALLILLFFFSIFLFFSLGMEFALNDAHQTASISILLRYSHHQIFVFIGKFINPFPRMSVCMCGVRRSEMKSIHLTCTNEIARLTKYLILNERKYVIFWLNILLLKRQTNILSFDSAMCFFSCHLSSFVLSVSDNKKKRPELWSLWQFRILSPNIQCHNQRTATGPRRVSITHFQFYEYEIEYVKHTTIMSLIECIWSYSFSLLSSHDVSFS